MAQICVKKWSFESMDEQHLLDRIKRRGEQLGSLHGSVVVGPGDNTAVMRSASGELTLVGVDQLLVGRHCTPDTPVELIARKAIARGVSDIAAMGGTPTWALAAAKLPSGYPHADELFEACAQWCEHWGCPLVGGDIATSEAELALSITVAGTPHPVRGPVLRSGAQPGDLVAVSGPIGDSFTSEWHLHFEPRLDVARKLCETLGCDLHAMMDLSDGLGLDACRLAAASGVRIEIDAARVPRRPGSDSGWRERLAQGEDYELLVALSPQTDTPPDLCVIGEVRAQRDLKKNLAVVKSPDGKEIDASAMGWNHA